MNRQARGALLGIAAFLVTDHHARGAIETRHSTDDRQIVCVHTIAVQLMEIGEELAHVIERIRALRVARHQRRLPGRELAVDFLGQILAFLLQTSDFIGDVDSRVRLDIA